MKLVEYVLIGLAILLPLCALAVVVTAPAGGNVYIGWRSLNSTSFEIRNQYGVFTFNRDVLLNQNFCLNSRELMQYPRVVTWLRNHNISLNACIKDFIVNGTFINPLNVTIQ